LPANGVVFVKAGAMAGGTGSRIAPFAAISEALAGITTGTIELSKGVFEGVIHLPRA